MAELNWIDVNERMPKEQDTVLAYVNGYIIEAWWSYRGDRIHWDFATLVYHGRETCWASSSDVVTHWSAYPSVPSDDVEGEGGC